MPCVCLELLDELLSHRALDSAADRADWAARLRAKIARRMGYLGPDEPDEALPRRLRGCPGRRKALDAIIWITRPPGRPPRATGLPLQPKYIAPGDEEPQPVKYLNVVRVWIAHCRQDGILSEAAFTRHLDAAIDRNAGLGAELAHDPEARCLLETAYREIMPDLAKRRSERALAVCALAKLAAVESAEKAIYLARRDIEQTLDELAAEGWDDPNEVIAPPAKPRAPRVFVDFDKLEALPRETRRPD